MIATDSKIIIMNVYQVQKNVPFEDIHNRSNNWCFEIGIGHEVLFCLQLIFEITKQSAAHKYIRICWFI